MSGHWLAVVHVTLQTPAAQTPGEPDSVHAVPSAAFCTLGLPPAQLPTLHMSEGVGLFASSSMVLACPSVHVTCVHVP
jgi:hypothetical protein